MPGFFYLNQKSLVPMNRILRPKEVAQLLSISIPTLYRMMDELPPKIRVGKRAVGWRESEIQDWLEERTENRTEEG